MTARILLLFSIIGFFSIINANDSMLTISALTQKNPEVLSIRADNRKALYVIKSSRDPQELPELRFFKYNVAKNDTFWGIANRSGLDADTIASINQLSKPGDIAGKTLFLPNMRGIFYSVQKSDTIESISKQYAIDKRYLMRINKMETLAKGTIFIPFGKISPEERQNFLNAGFADPVQNKKIRLSSPYGVRKDPFTHDEAFHAGIDIACPLGTPVKAIKDGTVELAETAGGYGKLVVIKHDKGYISMYGHLSRIMVTPGDIVKKGSIIAYSGNTGRTTGPHLHFEIRKNGKPLNPRHYVR